MIKIVLTKTGDQVITKLETYVDENNNPIGYLLTNPYIVKLIPTKELDEQGQPISFTINYTKWIATSEDIQYRVAFDFIAAVANPEKQLYDTYMERFGVELNDTTDGGDAGDNGTSDSGDSAEESGVSDSAD